jgi:putative redox protein
VSLHLDYRITGSEVDPAKVRRAIDLSLEKYCSVIHSLAPDMAITYALSLA